MSLIPLPQTINITQNYYGFTQSFGSWENIATPGSIQTISATPGTTIATFTGQTSGGGTPILLVAGNTFQVPLSGTYKIAISLQLTQGAGNQSVKFWLATGGIPIPDTASVEYIPSNSQIIASVELQLTLVALQTLQLYLQSTGGNSGLLTIGATATAPQSPAIILNIMKID